MAYERATRQRIKAWLADVAALRTGPNHDEAVSYVAIKVGNRLSDMSKGPQSVWLPSDGNLEPTCERLFNLVAGEAEEWRYIRLLPFVASEEGTKRPGHADKITFLGTEEPPAEVEARQEAERREMETTHLSRSGDAVAPLSFALRDVSLRLMGTNEGLVHELSQAHLELEHVKGQLQVAQVMMQAMEGQNTEANVRAAIEAAGPIFLQAAPYLLPALLGQSGPAAPPDELPPDTPPPAQLMHWLAVSSNAAGEIMGLAAKHQLGVVPPDEEGRAEITQALTALSQQAQAAQAMWSQVVSAAPEPSEPAEE